MINLMLIGTERQTLNSTVHLHTHIYIESWNKFYWCSYLVFLRVMWKNLMNSVISFYSYTLCVCVCVCVCVFVYILFQSSSPPSPLFSFTLHKILLWKKNLLNITKFSCWWPQAFKSTILFHIFWKTNASVNEELFIMPDAIYLVSEKLWRKHFSSKSWVNSRPINSSKGGHERARERWYRYRHRLIDTIYIHIYIHICVC